MQLIVGRIVRPHGIRGEVLVDVRTDDPELRFTAGSTFTVEPAVAGAPATLTLEYAKPHSGRLIAAFEEIPDRDAAEGARGALLNVDSSAIAPPEDPDEFHDHQLVGLDVVTLAGETVGVIRRVNHVPGADQLEVALTNGRTALVPFVRVIVPEVDLTGGRVVIDPPGGLLDL